MRNEPQSFRSVPRDGPETRLRDEGFAFVARANRWVISGAVVLAAAVSALTAHAFHAHAAAPPASSTAGAQQSSSSQQSGDDGSSAALQAPSQAPSVAPSAPAPVVSGGS
jgi:hypothetical protein